MSMSTTQPSLFGATSFEARSLKGPEEFLKRGGSASSAFLARLADNSDALRGNLERLRQLGFSSATTVDRFRSRALWNWAWRSVSAASSDIIVDATCIPRELLGMLLFALSVQRDRLDRVRIFYTTPQTYVTQRRDVPDDRIWLSRGIRTVRSILGYPGDFDSERNRHVVALAGHEDDRLSAIIEYLEPTRLSISNEQGESSTVAGADRVSEKVKARLRESIGRVELGEVVFYANSIDRTFTSLKQMLAKQTHENIALIAMNTKLSFVGAALCGLHLRHVRMVYAVPNEYNPGYSEGVRELKESDITALVKSAATTPVHQAPAESHQRA